MSDSKPSILLVEEDPKQTELYSALIREFVDVKIDSVSRLDQSMDWVGSRTYAMVLIDLGRKLESLPMIERIKQMSPMTSVVVWADRPTVEHAVTAIRMGAEDFFKKPFKLDAFQMAVRRGLDRAQIFGQDAAMSDIFSLLTSCQMISASLDQERILRTVHGYLTSELRTRFGAVYRLEGEEAVRIASLGDSSVAPSGGTGYAPHADDSMAEILDIAVRSAGVVHQMVTKKEYEIFVERAQLSPALFAFRFKCAEPNDLIYVALSPAAPTRIEEFRRMLKMLRTQIEVTGRNISHFRGVETLAYLDDATGLYNTRYLGPVLEREIAQADASRRSFGVLFIDIDKFKQVNDSHGHVIGTKLLVELGELLKTQVRDTDTVFRYGGDEFLAVLSGCDLPTAQHVAERIRQAIERHAFLKHVSGYEKSGLHFTVSIGLALYPLHAKSKQDIIDAADRAMYEAKRDTRNRVSLAK